MSKRTFVFDLEWAEVLKEYRPEVRHEVYDAIIEYASSGTLSGELKPLAMMAFSFIKRQMDYNRERYESEIEKKREGGRRSAAARQREPGGEEASPAKTDTLKDSSTDLNTLQQSSTMPNTPKDSLADSSDIDIVIDNDIDIDKLLTFSLGVGGDQELLVRNAYMDVFFGTSATADEFIRRWETTPEELREVCETVLDEWTVFNEVHTSADDARKHFVSAVRTRYEKKIRQKKTRRSEPKKGTTATRKSEDSAVDRIDRQQKERDEAFEEMKRKAVKPRDYISSLGYDPDKVSMIQVLNPEWRAQHPPTETNQTKEQTTTKL